MKVTILGTGAFGLAVGSLWHQYSGQEILFWTPFKNEYDQITINHEVSHILPDITLAATLKVTMDLKQALLDSTLLVIAVPMAALSSVLEQVRTVNDHIPTIILSKGIETKKNDLPHQIYQESKLVGDYGYLGGPTFAIDVIQNKPTGFVLASCSDDIQNKVHLLFQNTNITIQKTEDILGVEYCSGLKNVFAIFMGAVCAKFSSESTKAYFLTLFYQEYQRLIVTLGGKIETLSSVAGIGDLLLTCNSSSSRNYHYGMLLVNDFEASIQYSKEVTVEGKNTLYSVLSILKEKNIHSKLLLFLKELIDHKVQIEQVIELL